jgi:ABC-type methionine transport system ATPase subunit
VTQPRLDVGVVFYRFVFFLLKRLKENVAYCLELKGISYQGISAAVERYVGLMGPQGRLMGNKPWD